MKLQWNLHYRSPPINSHLSITAIFFYFPMELFYKITSLQVTFLQQSILILPKGGCYWEVALYFFPNLLMNIPTSLFLCTNKTFVSNLKLHLAIPHQKIKFRRQDQNSLTKNSAVVLWLAISLILWQQAVSLLLFVCLFVSGFFFLFFFFFFLLFSVVSARAQLFKASLA